MTCKVTVQKNTFSESLAIVGRAVGNHVHLPILANVLLNKEEGQLRLSATNLTIGVSVWMDAKMDGDLGLTLPAKTLTDVVNSLSDPEVIFSVNGKPEASLTSGSFKGVVKGIAASEFPNIPEFDVSSGIPLEADAFKEMIQNVAFAASVDDVRPVLSGVLFNMDGKAASMVATDGFRLAMRRAELPLTLSKKQLIIPAVVLKEVVRILGATKAAKITLFLPTAGNQIVLRCENVQIVSQLIDGKFPDFQAILPKGFKTRTVVGKDDLLKACKQAAIIARESSNVVHFHLMPSRKVKLKAESAEAGVSEVELDATIEGLELDIALNVKFLQEALEAISAKNVVIETNAFNTPVVIRPADAGEGYLHVLMPKHVG